jgi:transcription initiation factor TFIIH subunit 1
MRPTRADKVPIIRTLNSLSERIMAHIEPADVDPSEPIGMDEATFNQLALRDLQAEAREDRIVLKISDQKRFFSQAEHDSENADAKLYAAQDPRGVLSNLQIDLDPDMMEIDAAGGLNLRAAIGVREDSDSEEDADDPRPAHVGSRAGFSSATAQIFEAIAQRRSQTDDLAEGSGAALIAASGLSPALYERLSLTHATTTEFLHHFWLGFLSGDPDRAGELAKLVETLDRAMARIKAVADDADAERASEIEKKKKDIRDIYQATGKKLKWSSSSIGGGSAVVNHMLGPTVKAVSTAVSQYQKALVAEGSLVEASA